METIAIWCIVLITILGIMYNLDIFNTQKHLKRLLGIKTTKSYPYRGTIQNELFRITDKKDKLIYSFDYGQINRVGLIKRDSFSYDTIYVLFEKKDRAVFSISEDEIDLPGLYDTLEQFFQKESIVIKAMDIFLHDQLILYKKSDDIKHKEDI